MNETDPDITFDRNGVCNHCKNFEVINWQRIWDKEKLPTLLAKIKEYGRGKKYDVLIGLSGGVDSSTALVYLVDLGLRPLCFSVDNGWNTKEADENIMRLVEGLKVPFYRFVIDIPRFKELQEAFLKSGIKNIEATTDHVLMALTYKMAIDNRIKWIVSGGNLSTEAIMPTRWGHNARDLRLLKGIYRRFTKKRLHGLPLLSLWKYLVVRFIRKISIVNLLDYFEYNRSESVKMLEERFGYKDYGDKHCESAFTAWFQNYYLPRKFNIDKRRAHYSSMICSKQVLRDEAIQLLAQPLTAPSIPSWDYYAEDENRHEYTEYPNSTWIWELLSNIYRAWKF